MKRLIGIPLSIAAASAVAMANFTLTFTSSASDTWQLVGASQGMDISTLVGSSTTPGSAASVIESAWYYNDTTLQWEVAANTFNPAQVGYTLLTATNPYQAVWMRVKGNSAATAAVSTTTDGTDVAFTVSAGWNLRATSEAISTTSATQLVKYPFLNDKTNGVLVYTYNISTNAFEVYSPNGFVSTFTGTQFTSINQYEGFWIKVTNAKTYTIASAAAAVTASLPVTDGIIGDPNSLITVATLADNVINNFSTLLKFGPESRLAQTSLTSFSGTAAGALSDYNATMRAASNQVIKVRDEIITAKENVDAMVQQLSITGFVSVSTISGPIAKVTSLVDDINQSVYRVSGAGENNDYNLTETNGSILSAIDYTDALNIGFGEYLATYGTTNGNTTALDPILLDAIKGRDKVSALKSHLDLLATSYTDLNTTMIDLNTSVYNAVNSSDKNATVTITAPDVNSSPELVKAMDIVIGEDTIDGSEINGSHSILITFTNSGGTPSSISLDLNSTSSGTYTDTTVAAALSSLGLTYPADNNESVLKVIEYAIDNDATMSALVSTDKNGTANIDRNLTVYGKPGTGNFGLAVSFSTVYPGATPGYLGEMNTSLIRAYDAAITGSSQTTSLTFDGTFRGGDVIELNISTIEDVAATTDIHSAGVGFMDSNVSLTLTSDKTGAEVAALLSTEINNDTTFHPWGDVAGDTTGTKSVSSNIITLDANDTFIGKGYTLLLTVNGNAAISTLETAVNTAANQVYIATSEYATLNQASGSTSIVSWDSNASNFHQAVEGVRFTTLSVDGTVYTDNASRLVWSLSEESSLTGCGASNKYNINTWALPTIPELLTLYDATTNKMSSTWLTAVTGDSTFNVGGAITITPTSNLDRLYFVSKDGNVSNSVITVETERRVLSASGMTVREYNSTDTTVHMSPHCVAQQTSTTDFDEYYNTNRFGTGNTLTNLSTTALSALTDADKRVADAGLNVEWERKVTVTSSTAPFDTYANAEYYCAILNHGAKTDWRLPTIEELTSLNLFDIEARYNLDQASSGLNRSTLFLYDFNDSSNYWTSDINGTDSYKVVNPVGDISYTNMFGTTSPSTGATNTRVICVRDQ